MLGKLLLLFCSTSKFIEMIILRTYNYFSRKSSKYEYEIYKYML